MLVSIQNCFVHYKEPPARMFVHCHWFYLVVVLSCLQSRWENLSQTWTGNLSWTGHHKLSFGLSSSEVRVCACLWWMYACLCLCLHVCNFLFVLFFVLACLYWCRYMGRCFLAKKLLLSSSFLSLKCYTKFVFSLGLSLLIQVYGQVLLGKKKIVLSFFIKFKMLH